MVVHMMLGTPKAGDKVEMYINSLGGVADAGLELADKIQALVKDGVHFKCVASDAASAAFMIWAACNERLVLPYGTIMFHYPFVSYMSGQLRSKDFEKEALEAKTMETLWRGRWNSYMVGFVTEANQEKAAIEETWFLGKQFCLTFAPGFCKVIYQYKYLEDQKL